MFKKTINTLSGKLSISIPSTIQEITIGQVIEMQERPLLTDLEALSILSGAPLAELQNIKKIDEVYVFGEIILLLSGQLKSLYSNEQPPKQITFNFINGIKTVPIPRNLSVEPVGAFFAAREIIAGEIGEHIRKYGENEWQSTFNPSLKTCCQVLAHYFYCGATGKLYNEYDAEEFNSEIKKLRVMEALPIAKHFFHSYPNLLKVKTGFLNRLRQRWKKKRESALLKSLNISIQ